MDREPPVHRPHCSLGQECVHEWLCVCVCVIFFFLHKSWFYFFCITWNYTLVSDISATSFAILGLLLKGLWFEKMLLHQRLGACPVCSHPNLTIFTITFSFCFAFPVLFWTIFWLSSRPLCSFHLCLIICTALDCSQLCPFNCFFSFYLFNLKKKCFLASVLLQSGWFALANGGRLWAHPWERRKKKSFIF